LAAPVPRTEKQACACCGIDCVFHMVDAPRPDVPSFLTPLFPDQCWVGWSWSAEVPDKLVLVAFCSQTCLVHWFENRDAAVSPESGAP
jgi:hypothetical protein